MKMYKNVNFFKNVSLRINKVATKGAVFLPKEVVEIKKNYTFAA
jgi:hypothetical protein